MQIAFAINQEAAARCTRKWAPLLHGGQGRRDATMQQKKKKAELFPASRGGRHFSPLCLTSEAEGLLVLQIKLESSHQNVVVSSHRALSTDNNRSCAFFFFFAPQYLPVVLLHMRVRIISAHEKKEAEREQGAEQEDERSGRE